MYGDGAKTPGAKSTKRSSKSMEKDCDRRGDGAKTSTDNIGRKDRASLSRGNSKEGSPTKTVSVGAVDENGRQSVPKESNGDSVNVWSNPFGEDDVDSGPDLRAKQEGDNVSSPDKQR